MLSKRWPKLLVLCIGLILVYSQFTDADFIVRKYLRDNIFRATTLDFSNRRTANEFPTSTLFNITNLIPEGFEISSIRIKKEGEQHFNYQIRSEITQSSLLCEQLQISILNKNFGSLYSGPLINLSLRSSVNQNYEDLIIMVALNNDVGGNKRCDFNLIVETYNQNGNSKKGLWDEEILSNFISS